MTQKKYQYEYIVVQAYKAMDLEKTVSNFITASGFELVGGLAITTDNGRTLFCQALIKKSLRGSASS